MLREEVLELEIEGVHDLLRDGVNDALGDKDCGVVGHRDKKNTITNKTRER